MKPFILILMALVAVCFFAAAVDAAGCNWHGGCCTAPAQPAKLGWWWSKPVPPAVVPPVSPVVAPPACTPATCAPAACSPVNTDESASSGRRKPLRHIAAAVGKGAIIVLGRHRRMARRAPRHGE